MLKSGDAVPDFSVVDLGTTDLVQLFVRGIIKSKLAHPFIQLFKQVNNRVGRGNSDHWLRWIA